jgi:VWFA-related protein
MSSTAPLLWALLLATAGARPSSPPPDRAVVRDSASVSLVEVPVQVIGRDGKPVRGLTAADFELEADGKKQTVTALDVVDLHRTREVAGFSSEIPPAARRHLLFLFDLTYATSAQVVRAREAATRFIVSGMDPNDLAAVATTSVERGARLQMTFTTDRRQLVAAIAAVGLPSETEKARDPLAFVFALPGDPTGSTSSQEQGRANAAVVDPTSTTRLYAAMAQKSADDYAVTRVGRHLVEMSSLAAALDAIEGRKTIIYFSEGFDGRLLFGSVARARSLEEMRADNDAMYGGKFWTFDVDRRFADGPLQRDLAETIGLFQRSDCVVYPIDISGLKTEGDPSLGASGRGEESLFAFAHGTGGELLRNANDLTAQLKRIAEKTSLAYVLTFRAPAPTQEGRFHALKVRVRGSGVRVSSRAGYYETKSFQSMGPLQRLLSAADVIAHEKQEGSFPMEVLAFSLGGEKVSSVPVLLELPPAAFAGARPEGRYPLELYVYVTDETGKVADFFARVLTVDTGRDGERLRRTGLLFYGTVGLLPGRYRIRAYARDGNDGRFAFRVASLDVPDLAATPMRALPPLFVNDADGVRWRDQAPGAPVAGSERDPFRIGQTPFVPQIVPTVAAGGSSRICLMLYRKGAGAAVAPFQIDAEVVGAEGGLRRPARLALIGRSEPDAEGLVTLLLDFSASDLPAGDYSLRVVFRDAGDERVRSESEARFRVS